MGKYSKLLKAINGYIKKSDDGFGEQLTIEGFIESLKTVETINNIEERLTKILQDEKEYFIDAIAQKDIEVILDEILPLLMLSDIAAEDIAELFKEQLKELMISATNSYIQSVDTELSFNTFTTRTAYWIESWSEELGGKMAITSHEKIQSILVEALSNGESVAKVTDKLMESYGFSRKRARSTAITEMLTAHSVSVQEAMTQNPVVARKKWKHTGSHKNNPRKNHQDFSDTIVPKNEPFKINGLNESQYPMYPRATNLPPSERINCHCIVQQIVDDDVIGMTLEEREALQKKAIDEDDRAWEKELDAKNKARAGINENTINYDWLRSKDKSEQINYFGGVKAKWALLESGVIQNDRDLDNMFKTVTVNKNGQDSSIKALKTLNELQDSGIIVIKHSTLNHATVGEWINPSRLFPNGRLRSGGHGQTNIDELKNSGISYSVEKTYSNGVRIGGVEGHKSNNKLIGTTGQSWFPKNWDDDKILLAGTHVANNGTKSGITIFGDYDGVRLGMYLDTDGKPSTIFPDNSKQPNNEEIGDNIG